MLEIRGDILSNQILHKADAICFTSNGILRQNGRLVMGAGVAKAFRDYFRDLDLSAGKAVNRAGNICQIILEVSPIQLDKVVSIVAFPTKHDWRDNSDPVLIRQSAKQLRELANLNSWKQVYLPRPGCRNGKLSWRDIKPVLEEILDDRFYCITF